MSKKKKFITIIFLFMILSLGLLKNNRGEGLPPVLNEGNLQRVAAPQAVPQPLNGSSVVLPSAPPTPVAVPPPPAAAGMPPAPPAPLAVPPAPPFNNTFLNLNAIPKILETARIVITHIQSGKIWTTRMPAGEIEIKGGIVYQNRVIGVIAFNPIDGNILPCGYKPKVFTPNIEVGQIKNKLNEIIKELKVVEAVEYREPENAWIIPITYRGIRVSELKITGNGEYIIPDYVADQEMNLIGR